MYSNFNFQFLEKSGLFLYTKTYHIKKIITYIYIDKFIQIVKYILNSIRIFIIKFII